MTPTTTISTDIRPGRIAATVDANGTRLGHVVCKGLTFAASRKAGTTTDIRRYATNFKTVEAAARWVAVSA